jgi:hypothetical protein
VRITQVNKPEKLYRTKRDEPRTQGSHATASPSPPVTSQRRTFAAFHGDQASSRLKGPIPDDQFMIKGQKPRYNPMPLSPTFPGGRRADAK